MKGSDDTDDDYFGFAQSTGDTSQSPGLSTNKYELEVLQFLEDARKDVAVLNSCPTVKMPFLKFNSVLPSSPPVERLFSFVGIITRPHRCKMGDKTFEQLLLLKEN